MVQQTWIVKCTKYRQSHEVDNENNGKQESRINIKGTNFIGDENLGGIFPENSLSPLLFEILMMTLNYVLRKFTGGYTFTKLQEKINHLTYMDDVSNLPKRKKVWRL